VPPVVGYNVRDMSPKAAFEPDWWGIVFQKAMMENDHPSTDDQALLVNAIAHESRHAEQSYAAARLYAGKHRDAKPKEIAQHAHVAESVAKLAKAQPITSKNTQGAELAFAKTMGSAYGDDFNDMQATEYAVDQRGKALTSKNAALAAAVVRLRREPTFHS